MESYASVSASGNMIYEALDRFFCYFSGHNLQNLKTCSLTAGEDKQVKQSETENIYKPYY